MALAHRGPGKAERAGLSAREGRAVVTEMSTLDNKKRETNAPAKPIETFELALNGKSYGAVEITPLYKIKVKILNFEQVFSADSRFEEVLTYLIASKVLAGLEGNEILDLINRLGLIFEGAKQKIKASAEDAQSPLPESPLTGEDPLHVLLAPLRRTVIMETAIESIIIAALSAYTINPLNTVVLKKKTSEGGTYTLLEVLKIFPPEDVIKLGYATPTSFFHERIEGFVDKVTNEDITEKLEALRDEVKQLEKDVKRFKNDIQLAKELEEKKKKLREMLNNAVGIINLWNKIIVFTEPPNAELFAKLKPLLSHDDLYVEAAYTDSSNEGIRTMHVRIQGWPAVFTVFSEDEVSKFKQGLVTDPQLFSRFLKIEINNNPQKFKGVIKYDAVQVMVPHVLNSNYEEQLKKAQDYVRYLKNVLTRIKSAYNPISTKYTSINLFAGIMAKDYDAKVGEDMRSFRMLLTLIELRAWLYYDYRLKINDKGRIRVIVHADDVKAILDRFGSQITSHLPKTKISEFETLKQILENGAKSAEEIFESGAFSYSSPRSLRTNLLSLLVKYGYLKAFTDSADQRHRKLLYAISGFNGMDLLALPPGCDSDAIYAIIKRFLMKWLSVGQVLMAWKVASKGIDNMQDIDTLIREYILGQNDVFHAIKADTMKQSMASMALQSHPKDMPLDYAIKVQESTKPADPIQGRFEIRKMVTPEGGEAQVYTCRTCGRLFLSAEEAEQHEC